MAMQKLLIQTQLSNYNTQGKFILECDSGWQMVMGRVREMLKNNRNLHITVMCPEIGTQVVTPPYDINRDLWDQYGFYGENRLLYLDCKVIPNALVTRYDFDWKSLSEALELGKQKHFLKSKYDVVYINDPMHLRNFKALFHVEGGYQPKFFVHSHFVDVPSCPKFPSEASLWLGQCEAAIKADWNFWQCESALIEFAREARKIFNGQVVDDIISKSSPWDDGYSTTEINSLVNYKNVRFNPKIFDQLREQNKSIIFVPNRIGGKGRSSDYTNCGKFMFELLPKIRAFRDDFVVIAGNPSQKILNVELEKACGENGYISLVPDTFNRDEFKAVAANSDIALGLYDQDTYGGTAARECVELGCVPLWLDIHEYSSITQMVPGWPWLVNADFSNFTESLNYLLSCLQRDNLGVNKLLSNLQKVVRERCSYESTTPLMMQKMGLLP